MTTHDVTARAPCLGFVRHQRAQSRQSSLGTGQVSCAGARLGIRPPAVTAIHGRKPSWQNRPQSTHRSDGCLCKPAGRIGAEERAPLCRVGGNGGLKVFRLRMASVRGPASARFNVVAIVGAAWLSARMPCRSLLPQQALPQILQVSCDLGSLCTFFLCLTAGAKDPVHNPNHTGRDRADRDDDTSHNPNSYHRGPSFSGPGRVTVHAPIRVHVVISPSVTTAKPAITQESAHMSSIGSRLCDRLAVRTVTPRSDRAQGGHMRTSLRRTPGQSARRTGIRIVGSACAAAGRTFLCTEAPDASAGERRRELAR